MQQIRKDIYDGLFVTPFTEHVQGKPDSLGDTDPGENIEYRCFLVESFEKVLNELGAETLSGMQLYVRGEDAIKIHNDSKFTCGAAVKQSLIAKKTFRGREGAPVIGVLYLP